MVFPFIYQGKKYAFRCWHVDIDSFERYPKIAKAIEEAKLPFLYSFRYVEKGFKCNGESYPAIIMPWMEGEILTKYICKHRNDKMRLRKLAEDFLKMCRTMHQHKFSHGDLHHENIIVNEDGKMQLVDYDSFYCEELRGEKVITAGKVDYQHPRRVKWNTVSEKMDYFSELVIYISLLAIAQNTNYIDEYNIEKSERLLFSANDYKDIRHSKIYLDLAGRGNEFKKLLDILDDYLKHDLDGLYPFEEGLNPVEILEFYADSYTFKGVPVTFRWNVAHACSVVLNGEQVEEKGSKEILVNGESQVFVLEAYGYGHCTKDKAERSIVCLPVPVIKSIQYDMPNVAINMSLAIKKPEFMKHISININRPKFYIGQLSNLVLYKPNINVAAVRGRQLKHANVSLGETINRVMNLISKFNKK